MCCDSTIQIHSLRTFRIASTFSCTSASFRCSFIVHIFVLRVFSSPLLNTERILCCRVRLATATTHPAFHSEPMFRLPTHAVVISPSSLLSLSLLFIIISSFLVFPIIKQFAGHTLLCVAEKQIPHAFIGGCSEEKRKILNCKIALKRACCPLQSTDLVWPCNCCLPNNEPRLDGESSVENA